MCSPTRAFEEHGEERPKNERQGESHTHEHDWILCRMQLNEIDMI